MGALNYNPPPEHIWLDDEKAAEYLCVAKTYFQNHVCLQAGFPKCRKPCGRIRVWNMKELSDWVYTQMPSQPEVKSGRKQK